MYDHSHFQIVFNGAPMPLQVCKFGMIDMLQFYRTHLVLKPVCLMDLEDKKQNKRSAGMAVLFTAVAWQQVTLTIIMYRFCLCDYARQLKHRSWTNTPVTMMIMMMMIW